MRQAIDQIAREHALRAFEGRKGHGGGACTKRVLTYEQLRALLWEAAADGANEAATRERAREREYRTS